LWWYNILGGGMLCSLGLALAFPGIFDSPLFIPFGAPQAAPAAVVQMQVDADADAFAAGLVPDGIVGDAIADEPVEPVVAAPKPTLRSKMGRIGGPVQNKIGGIADVHEQFRKCVGQLAPRRPPE
jgi:hypothetical protein